jgi:YbgC/YbaW family acyl-CoA thioester hydrolase
VIPDPGSPIPVSEHRYRRRAQFAEVDAARIVHFSRYFRYMEEAEHELWRSAGLSIMPPDYTVGWARVGASFDYHAPLRFEEEFDVLIRIAKIGGRSIRYECAITRGDPRIATGTMTVVCVMERDGAMVSAPIPPEIASRFAVSPQIVSPEARA